MTLFGNIIPRIAAPEPTATLALDYILNSSVRVTDAFLGILDVVGIKFERGRIDSERRSDDGSIPDLTIHDQAGNRRVLVENKFWAGLTDAQPVTYLNGLPENLPSVLLFIVPEARIGGVWSELRKRCNDAELDMANEDNAAGTQWTHLADGKTLMITSWTTVLDRLQQAADGDQASDIRQLRGLTNRMDQEAFLPLRADEATDANLARRLINYSGLVEPTVERLVEQGIADTTGLRPAHGYFTAGRYLRVHNRFGLWLGVELEVWRDSGGITPLWCRTGIEPFYGIGELWSEIPDLFDDVVRYPQSQYIPIRLKIGVERDQVIDHAVCQMLHIANTLHDD